MSLVFNAIQKKVKCPLCETPMEKLYDVARDMHVFACHKDKIAVYERDPLLGRWEEFKAAMGEEGKIECPNCNADMRFFATSTGFIKCRCPKKSCGATLTTSKPDEVKQFNAKTGELEDKA